MSTIILGVGDFGVSKTPGDVIKTLALGSCVAVVLLEPSTRSVGMVHVALPESSIDRAKALRKPGYFADTGFNALLEAMKLISCVQNEKKFIAKMTGGAQVLDPHNTFNIGKRNELALKKILWHHGMGVQAEDVGGHISRSIAVDVDTGRVVITSAGRGSWQM
jgi:chemotaxis protein CheD